MLRQGAVAFLTSVLLAPGTAVAAVVLTGTQGPDVLDGTMQGDTILGLGGDDVLRGFAGGDVLRGGPGQDKIWGGHDDDEVYGGSGFDIVRAGAGDDLVHSRAGGGSLFGGPGNDRIFGGVGPEYIIGGVGHDLVRGGGGDDDVAAGYGDDRVYGGPGNDSLTDTDIGSPGPGGVLGHVPEDEDLLVGGRGRDTLAVQSGPDVARAGIGDDRIKLWGPDGSRDLIDCGPGNDVVVSFGELDPLDTFIGCERTVVHRK